MGTSPDADAQVASVLDVARKLYAVDSTVPAPRPSDRRGSPRLGFAGTVKVYILGAAGLVQCSFEAVARDVGEDGIAIECTHMMHDGTHAWVELTHPDESQLLFFATVRYCVHEGLSAHRVGLEFGKAPEGVQRLAA
jgi:hypothetical protein